MKSKTKASQKPIKSDFYTILMWVSLVGLFTFIPTLWPSLVREQLGTIPMGWYGYWIPSSLIIASGFILAARRRRLGAEIIIAVSVADALIPMLLFKQLRIEGPLDLVLNLAFATAWLIFLKTQPKFMIK